MQRMKRTGERGATAVLVALMMVALLGVAAIAVDMGALWWDRKQLQNGADAGALAIAQSCAQGACSDTSDVFAASNKLGADATGTVESLTSNSVTVRTDTTRTHWFAQFLNINQSAVEARATASWGKIGGASTIPLTMNQCIFQADGVDKPEQWMRLLVKGKGVDDATDPCVPSGTPHIVPGGFHWLNPEGPEICKVSTDAGGEAPGDTGAQPKNSSPCTRAQLQQRILDARDGGMLIPMYSVWNGVTGNGAKFKLVGYASFKPTAWCLSPKEVEYGVGKCSADELYLDGYFTRTVSLSGELTDTGPDFQSYVVVLKD